MEVSRFSKHGEVILINLNTRTGGCDAACRVVPWMGPSTKAFPQYSGCPLTLSMPNMMYCTSMWDRLSRACFSEFGTMSGVRWTAGVQMTQYCPGPLLLVGVKDDDRASVLSEGPAVTSAGGCIHGVPDQMSASSVGASGQEEDEVGGGIGFELWQKDGQLMVVLLQLSQSLSENQHNMMNKFCKMMKIFCVNS